MTSKRPINELTDTRKGGPVISRTLVLSAALLLFSGIPAGHAQDNSAQASHPQSDSLGDAARKARAQKPHSSKPAKVFTNDDVHNLKDPFSGKAQPKAARQTSSTKSQPQH